MWQGYGGRFKRGGIEASDFIIWILLLCTESTVKWGFFSSLQTILAEAQVDQAIELLEGSVLGQKKKNNAEANEVAIGTWKNEL